MKCDTHISVNRSAVLIWIVLAVELMWIVLAVELCNNWRPCSLEEGYQLVLLSKGENLELYIK